MQLDHLEHRADVIVSGRFRHAAGPRVAITRKWAHRPGQDRALLVSFAGHDRGYSPAERAAFHTVVAIAITHDERAEIAVSEAERPENVRILRDLFDGITCVVDQDLLSSDENAHSRFEPLDVECAIPGFELHQIEGSEVAGCIVEKQIFRTRIG